MRYVCTQQHCICIQRHSGRVSCTVACAHQLPPTGPCQAGWCVVFCLACNTLMSAHTRINIYTCCSARTTKENLHVCPNGRCCSVVACTATTYTVLTHPSASGILSDVFIFAPCMTRLAMPLSPYRPHLALQWSVTNGVQAADLNPYSPTRSINWDGALPPRPTCLTRPNVQLTAGLLNYMPSMDYTTGVTEQQLMAMLQQVRGRYCHAVRIATLFPCHIQPMSPTVSCGGWHVQHRQRVALCRTTAHCLGTQRDPYGPHQPRRPAGRLRHASNHSAGLLVGAQQ